MCGCISCRINLRQLFLFLFYGFGSAEHMGGVTYRRASPANSKMTADCSVQTTAMVLGYRDQPLKAIYISSQFLLTVFIRVPFLILISIPRGLRPGPFKQAALIRLMRIVSPLGPIMSKFVDLHPSIVCLFIHFAESEYLAQITDSRAIAQGEGMEGLWIELAPELVTGNIKM